MIKIQLLISRRNYYTSSKHFSNTKEKQKIYCKITCGCVWPPSPSLYNPVWSSWVGEPRSPLMFSTPSLLYPLPLPLSLPLPTLLLSSFSLSFSSWSENIIVSSWWRWWRLVGCVWPWETVRCMQSGNFRERTEIILIKAPYESAIWLISTTQK